MQNYGTRLPGTGTSLNLMEAVLRPCKVEALIQRQDLNPAVQQVLNYESDEAIHLSLSNIEHALPGSIVLSESVADYLAVHHFEEYGADLIDVSEISKNIYALREKGSSAI